MTPTMDIDLHERLVTLDDPESGLKGVIALHSTARGPAAGGTRFWQYGAPEELVLDAARLSRGMSYKNALAGLPLGGGKAVLQRPEGAFDRSTLFKAFGAAVEALEGRYVTAEDVGTTVADMTDVKSRTNYVAGLAGGGTTAGGDPSPWTARGVFECLKEVAETRLNLPLNKATVAVQGIGNVGMGLCHLLSEQGVKLIVADVDGMRALRTALAFDAVVMPVDEIVAAQADIFAPCALGAVINDRTLDGLKVSAICGAANNQLESERHGEDLRQKGILYAPDYVVNAGGIINVCAEYLGETTADVETRVLNIPAKLREILDQAAHTSRPSNLVADEMARAEIKKAEIKRSEIAREAKARAAAE